MFDSQDRIIENTISLAYYMSISPCFDAIMFVSVCFYLSYSTFAETFEQSVVLLQLHKPVRIDL